MDVPKVRGKKSKSQEAGTYLSEGFEKAHRHQASPYLSEGFEKAHRHQASQVAGTYLSEGRYGCVYLPPLDCKVNTKKELK